MPSTPSGGVSSGSIAQLQQYPYVDVFRLPTFDPTRRLKVVGDVKQVTDPWLHRRVWNLKGDLGANNHLTFPADPGSTLKLTGRFIYLLFRASPEKTFSFHLELTTSTGPTVRLSLSNAFKKKRVTPTQLQWPFPATGKWTVVAIDAPALIILEYPTRTYQHLRSIHCCAHMAVRTVLTSAVLFDAFSLPYNASFPLPDKGADWKEHYEWVWIAPPADDDPAERGMAPNHTHSRSVSLLARRGPSTPMSRGAILAGGSPSVASSMSCTGTQLTLERIVHVSRPQSVYGRGRKVLWVSGNTIVECDTDTQGQRHLVGHSSPVVDIFIDPNRRVVGSIQNHPPTLRMWDAGSSSALGVVPLSQHFADVAKGCVALHSTVLVVGHSAKKKTTLLLLDTSKLPHAGPMVKHSCDATIHAVAVAPCESTRFATCDRTSTLRFWRVKDGVLRMCCVNAGGGERLCCIAFEPPRPGATLELFAGSEEGCVHRIDFDTLTPISSHKVHTGAVRSIAPSESLCATGGEDGYVRLWYPGFENHHLETHHHSPVTSVHCSRDGLGVVVTTEAMYVGVVDFPTHTVTTLLRSHTSRITAVAFHPSKPLVATASTDHTIRVWDTLTFHCEANLDCTKCPPETPPPPTVPPMETVVNEEGAPLAGPPEGAKEEGGLVPESLVWSPEETRSVLVAGLRSGAIWVIDADHGCILHARTSHSRPVKELVFTPKWLVSAAADAMCFYDVVQLYHVTHMVRFVSPCGEVAMAYNNGLGVIAALGPSGNAIHLIETDNALELGAVRDLEHDAPANCYVDVEWGPSDMLIAATSDGRLVQWQLELPLPPPPPPEDRDFGVPPAHITAHRIARGGGGTCGGMVCISPQRTWALALPPSAPHILALAPLPLPSRARAHRFAAHSDPISCAAWSSTSPMVISADDSGSVMVWTFTGRDPDTTSYVDPSLASPEKTISPPRQPVPALSTPSPPPPAKDTAPAPPQSPEDPSTAYHVTAIHRDPVPERGVGWSFLSDVRRDEVVYLPTPEESALVPTACLGCTAAGVDTMGVLGNGGVAFGIGAVVSLEDASRAQRLLVHDTLVTSIAVLGGRVAAAVLGTGGGPSRIVFWEVEGKGPAVCRGVVSLPEMDVASMAWGGDELLAVGGSKAVLVTPVAVRAVCQLPANGHHVLSWDTGMFLVASQGGLVSISCKGEVLDVVDTPSFPVFSIALDAGDGNVWGGGQDSISKWRVRTDGACDLLLHQPLACGMVCGLAVLDTPVKQLVVIADTILRVSLEDDVLLDILPVQDLPRSLSAPAMLADGSVAVRCVDGSVWALQEDMHHLIRPSAALDPAYLATCSGEAGIYVSAASREGQVGLWTAGQGTRYCYLGGADLGVEVGCLLVSERHGVVVGTCEGCAVLLCPTAEGGGKPSLTPLKTLRLSMAPLVAMAWAAEDALVAADRGGGFVHLDLANNLAHLLLAPSGDNVASSVDVLGSIALHAAHPGKATVFESLRPVACFTPPPSSSIRLATTTTIVYLQPTSQSLVFYDFLEASVTRILPLHNTTFDGFVLSPDRVYIVLWGSNHFITVYDYEHETFQEVEGHLVPVRDAQFVYSSTGQHHHLVTLATPRCDNHPLHTEVLVWRAAEL
eukprot:Sspe_Gene.26979::Locus_11419_Transcript_5_5_Confidence_0.500_Length_5094::g.26979::m.26979